MNAASALKIIRKCIAKDRVILTAHFRTRMEERGLFWADVLAVIAKPHSMRSDGKDEYDRERWFLSGNTPDRLKIAILCAVDATLPETVFVTLSGSKNGYCNESQNFSPRTTPVDDSPA